MHSLILAFCVAAITFAGGFVGLTLQHKLPEELTSGGARDMVSSVVGLLTFLCAIVTGLMIWTAYGVYATQNVAIQTFAARALQADLALTAYGPDASQGRKNLRDDLEKTIEQFWGRQSKEDIVSRNFHAAVDNLRARRTYLDSLHPANDEQKAALTAARDAIEAMGQTRLQMSLALTSPVSFRLLTIVVGWATFLFCGFGLMSRRNVMAYCALGVAALAVATTMYLIADLSDPYSGFIVTSYSPIERVMRDIPDSAK
jgi:hypothetical protein